MSKPSAKRRKRRSFTKEFKAEAAQLVLAGGRSIAQVAEDLDLTETALRTWVKQAEADAGAGPPGALTTQEREELTRLRRETKQLRMEREILNKSSGLLREGKHVRFTFILAEKAFYPIAVLCRVLKVSRSGFHAWAVRPPSRREVANRQLAVQVAAIHRESRCTYGSPRVTQELRASGQSVSRNRVARTMKIAGLVARPRKRFKQTTDSKHDRPIAPNILGRMFAAERPNQVWVTDVKAVRTTEGWLFVAPVIDLFFRKVVGLGVRENNDTALALEALNAAIANRHPAPGLVHHSDRGAPYASKDYRDRLQAVKSLASISRKGDCWDNAVAESFFSTLVHELLADQPILPMAATERSIREYIEKFYNPRRRHSTLGYVSPIEFELRQQNAALAA